MPFSRLRADDAPVAPLDALAELDLGALASAQRPYVVLNMVATVDGRATVEGRTAPISSEADRHLFHALRTCVDAIMVGAGTARIERYGRIVRDAQLRERRLARGLAGDPLALLVSGSLDLPADLPLLQDPDSRVAILTSSSMDLEGVRARVEYLRPRPDDGRRVDLAETMARLRTEHHIRSILCEGGPHLNASLLAAGLVDELFLTVAPVIAGGAGALSIFDDADLATPVALELKWLYQAEGELFARYALAGAPSANELADETL